MSQNNPKQEPVLSCINCGYTHKCSDTNSLKKSNSSKQEKDEDMSDPTDTNQASEDELRAILHDVVSHHNDGPTPYSFCNEYDDCDHVARLEALIASKVREARLDELNGLLKSPTNSLLLPLGGGHVTIIPLNTVKDRIKALQSREQDKEGLK